MTRSAKTLIPALLGVIAVAAFYFLVLGPKRDEVAKLETQVATEKTAAQQAELLAKQYEAAKDNYKANYAKVARLGKAVPADDDVRSLLVQIDAAAKESKVDFRSLNVSASSSPQPTDATAAVTAPGAVSVGSAGFSAMPFKFAFSGSYFQLSDFFTRLEKFVTVENERIDVTGRLLLLGSITVTPDSEQKGKLKAEIGAATYIVPPTTGVDGAPATAAPGAATTDPGTAPAGGSATTTTATITGVR